MKRLTFKDFALTLRGTAAAAALVFVTAPAALADGYTAGLQKFLDAPTSFVAISNGAPGAVTYASMMGDTLAIQFEIPTHSGNAFGEFVGDANAQGVFVGNGVLISDNGKGKAAPVTLAFQDDGTVIASVNGRTDSSGFMPTDMYYGH